MKHNTHWVTQGENGVTPLHDAARNGHLDHVPNEVLQSEAILQQDKKGWTTIHYAAQTRHLHQLPTKALTGLGKASAHISLLRRAAGIIKGQANTYAPILRSIKQIL